MALHGRGGLLRGVSSVFLLCALPLLVVPRGVAEQPTVEIQFLTVSDWHAQLDPLNVAGVGSVGGAAVLSSYWQAERAAKANTLTFTAGDSFGASPPLSNFFNEEPAVRAMNLMGFNADTLGNHNFDRGLAHLQQMIDLAEFPFLSANLENLEGNLSGVEPFRIFDVGGVKVGVIGITNPEAPAITAPGALGPVEITDPVPAANKAKAAARAAGAKVLVCLVHMGLSGFDRVTGEPVGRLIDFANDVGGFDVIFGDHTNVEFSGVINNALVVENRSFGRTYARVKLRVDPRNGRIAERSVEFITPLAAAVTPDPAIVALLAPFRAALAAVFDRVLGVATDFFPVRPGFTRRRDFALGNLIADAWRSRYGTQLAFINVGGIRSPLPSSYLPMDTSLRRPSPSYAAGPPFDLVLGDVFSVLPFGTPVVTRTVTGTQLYAVLEFSLSFSAIQVSGFRFSFDRSRPEGARILSVTLADGTPILPDGTVYTLATNSFLNGLFPALADGQGETRDLDATVVADYIQSLGVIAPVIEGRILDLTP